MKGIALLLGLALMTMKHPGASLLGALIVLASISLLLSPAK